jgi:hypothetical protein
MMINNPVSCELVNLDNPWLYEQTLLYSLAVCQIYSVLFNRRLTMLMRWRVWMLIFKSQRRVSTLCQNPRIVTSCQKCHICMLANNKSSI